LDEMTLFAAQKGLAGYCGVLMPQVCSWILGGVESLEDGTSPMVESTLANGPIN